jgi:hypothetical protein
VSPAHRWRRTDGTVLSGVDLTAAAPMMRDELDDIARLVDVVEDWLRWRADARDLLTDWLASSASRPRSVAAWAVIDQLGTLSVKLHRLIRAGTGHVHPPTG